MHLSLQSSLPTWWQLQSGFHLRELLRAFFVVVFCFFEGGEGAGGKKGGGAQNEKDRRHSPTSPKPFFLTSSDLSSLEEESQCQSCYGEIPEPPFRFPPRGPPLHLRAPLSQLRTQPTKLRLQTNFVPSKVSSGMFATQPLRRERGKKSKGFFFKFDGLLPSCLSPPPLPLDWPRWPGPSDPSSAGPCLQTDGRWGASTKNLRGLRAPKGFMPSVGRTRSSGQPPPPPTPLLRPPYPRRNWQACWRSDPITRLAGGPEPAPLSFAQESGLLASPAHQPPPISPFHSSLLSYPNPREEMGGRYGGRVLGSSTLGMKGIAGETRSPQSFQGASVFNKNSYLSTCTRLLASRSSAGEGRSPASDPPHHWSSGLPAVILSLCKNLLLIAVVEPTDSLLCLLRKVFLLFS